MLTAILILAVLLVVTNLLWWLGYTRLESVYNGVSIMRASLARQHDTLSHNFADLRKYKQAMERRYFAIRDNIGHERADRIVRESEAA